MVRLATCFSGIGAIEHAFKRMNIDYKLVFANDIDPFVKQSFFANYEITDNEWYNSVQDVDGKKYKDQIDLLVGGSPCQSFSMVGKRKGFADTRGTLFYEFARIIDEARPKSFIFENVRGLISHDQGDTWDTIKSVFHELNYEFYDGILNAKNYGIPQNRERLFVVGFREPRQFLFPMPVELELRMKDLLEDTINDKYYLPVKGVEFVTMQKNLDKRYTQINGDVALCQKANQQFNWHGDFVFEPAGKVDEKYFLSDKVAKYVLASGTKDFYSKPQTDLDVARPLLATMHKMHRSGVDNYVTVNGRIRKLTPRECLRLMGFDDTFKIVISDTQMYKQAGNSIVVDVLMHILNAMGYQKGVSECPY